MRTALLTGVAVLAAAVAAGAAGAAPQGKQQFTVYAVTTQVQYVNHADDITRGDLRNPFNVDTKSLPPQKKGKGPPAGNDAFYTFKLYSGPDLKRQIGTATFSCEFTFNNHASCEAFYELGNSTMSASGNTDFGKTDSTLAVTGGTGKYVGTAGQVESVGPGAKPAAKNESRFDFTLVR
jgi:hypothetical protein